MKQLFKLTVVIFASSLITCKSTKTTQKIKTYSRLDSISVKANMKEFSIEVPNTWYSYIDSHYNLSHTPIELSLNKKHYPKTYLNILKEKTKSNNIEELTKDLVERLTKKYKNFNYDLVKAKHPLYGRYNFIIYKKNIDFEDETIVNALILKGNYSYWIQYRSLSKHYRKYADDVVKMIHSFRVKE